ncbi:hypothetical protein J1N35_013936, partial [Gossypium stocksii]
LVCRTRPHLATTRPCLAHSLAFVSHIAVSSHTAYHTGDHTPVWHQQNSFLAFR